MASLGSYLLLAAFVMCAYATASSVAGARRRSQRLIESGIGAFYLIAAIMSVASSVIVYAFVSGDYSIKYVQQTSDSVQPLFYKITSFWGGLDGSIMFWVFLLSLFGSAAVYVNRERQRELIPYVVAVISIVQMFFLFLMVIHNNPFETYLTETPTDGAGLSPLLQNFYMAIHPPTMYTGFVGLTIPYAFGMAALITGYLDDSWVRAVRRWTMISWLFLSIGLGLGMIWAYEELGWGGYWGWDPVENAALLPWFTATAFLHSVRVQEQRGMLRVWNVTLVIITFFLTIFGTFMTRSGVVQSVHAFGEDPELARMFTIFMISILIVSFGLVIYRLPLLRARNELDSWVSREAAFLANNWILLFSAFFVLFATMFPTLSEAVTGERLTVGPAVLQQVDAAGRPDAAAAHRCRAAARLAQVHGRQSARSVPGADRRCRDRRRRALRPRRSRLDVGHLLRVLCLRHGHDWPGVLARRARAAGRHGHRRLHRAHRSGRAEQAPLRRLHRARRHRADLPRLCRRGIQAGRAGAAQAGPAGDGRRLHRPARRGQGHRRRAEADDHGPHDGLPRRRGDSRGCTQPSGSSESTRKSRRPRWPSAARSPRTSTS